MLSISFVKKEDDDVPYFRTCLEVNGILDEKSEVSPDDATFNSAFAHINSPEVIEIIRRSTFEEVAIFISALSFSHPNKFSEESFDVSIHCNEYYKRDFPAIKIVLPFRNYLHWAKPWSIAAFVEQFKFEVHLSKNEQIEYEESIGGFLDDEFSLVYKIADLKDKIGETLDHAIQLTETFIQQADEKLLKAVDSDIVSTYFQFPEEIKTACKQYLIYFAQFLADLGVEAEADVQEKEGKTLFTVTPKNREEGLGKIREALETYLNAPGDDSFEVQVMTQSDLSVGHWSSNVYFLKSQLSMAQMASQMQQATIESLKLSNYRYKEMLQLQAPKPTESEDLVKGIVSVKPYEGKGISVNLPEILRRLKRTFRK